MDFIIMDLEWNNTYARKTKGFINEIIEIGAVKLDENLNFKDKFSCLVRPQIGKKLRGSVSADDSDAFESYISTLSGAQAVIKQSSYNSTVSEYYRTARSMPAAVFGIFAKGPEFFGVEG